MFPVQVIIDDRFSSLEAVRTAMNVGALKDLMRVLPEDTAFFQACLVGFKCVCRVPGDITVNLQGKLERKRIKWNIRSVFIPAYPELLTELELRGLA